MINKQEVVRLYKVGVSKARIASKLKCSRKYVYDVLISKGLYKPKGRK